MHEMCHSAVPAGCGLSEAKLVFAGQVLINISVCDVQNFHITWLRFMTIHVSASHCAGKQLWEREGDVADN